MKTMRIKQTRAANPRDYRWLVELPNEDEFYFCFRTRREAERFIRLSQRPKESDQ
jgi:hypothetical protein